MLGDSSLHALAHVLLALSSVPGVGNVRGLFDHGFDLASFNAEFAFLSFSLFDQGVALGKPVETVEVLLPSFGDRFFDLLGIS